MFEKHNRYIQKEWLRKCLKCNSCAIDKILATCIGVLVNKKSDVGNTAAHNCYQAMKALDREPLTTEIVCHLHRAVMQGMTEGTTGKLRKTPFYLRHVYKHF